MVIEIDGRDYSPLYAGWVGDNYAQAIGGEVDRLTQFNLGVTAKTARGKVAVRVKYGNEKSDPVTIEFLEPQQIIPKINLISNAVDGGVDVHTRAKRPSFESSLTASTKPPLPIMSASMSINTFSNLHRSNSFQLTVFT